MLNDPPEEIKVIWRKTGLVWLPAERDTVKSWLNSEDQLTELRNFAFYILSRAGGTVHDAQDAWQNFQTSHRQTGETRIDHVINIYDPDYVSVRSVNLQPLAPVKKELREVFPGLLKFRFGIFCQLYGRREIKPIRENEQPLGEDWELDLAGTASPAETEYWDERLPAIRDCLRRLPSASQQILIGTYMHQIPDEVHAENLGISQIALRVRRLRALQKLRDCLKSKGFDL